MTGRVLFLPGNGHSAVRLAAARDVVAGWPEVDRFALDELHYPEAGSLEGLLDALTDRARAFEGEAGGRSLVFATGIGGLVALCLRARGELLNTDLVLQGAVLWGLEHRNFPKLMRLGIGRFRPGPRLLVALLKLPPIQRRFASKHFPERDATFRAEFFAGYRDAREFEVWFRWLVPELLRDLEQRFAEHPDRLERLEFWWGDRDQVVSLEELERSERALGRKLPRRTFEGWGHYPMIEQPADWCAEVRDALARTR